MGGQLSANVSIRRGAPSDLPTIQSLNSALFQYENSRGFYQDSFDLGWPYSEAGAKYFNDRLGDMTPGVVLIAEIQVPEHTEIVGYLAGNTTHPSYRSQTIAELENMFVIEPHRSQGVGGRLVDAFRDWARQNGATRLRVGAFAGNDEALKFYRHHGFADFELWLEQQLG